MAGDGSEAGAAAGAGDALPGFGQEEGAMAGALDQAATPVEELVGHPLQRNATVRTAVAVDVDLLALAHSEQTLAPDLEIFAAGVFQLVQTAQRSEEHTSELQSRPHLVCRLLLEKK